jgi:hypothetical protein
LPSSARNTDAAPRCATFRHANRANRSLEMRCEKSLLSIALSPLALNNGLGTQIPLISKFLDEAEFANNTSGLSNFDDSSVF